MACYFSKPNTIAVGLSFLSQIAKYRIHNIDSSSLRVALRSYIFHRSRKSLPVPRLPQSALLVNQKHWRAIILSFIFVSLLYEKKKSSLSHFVFDERQISPLNMDAYPFVQSYYKATRIHYNYGIIKWDSIWSIYVYFSKSSLFAWSLFIKLASYLVFFSYINYWTIFLVIIF